MCSNPDDFIKTDLLDLRIKKTKELFFQELARKKRNIKRQWMEINAVTNTHFLQMLPYRSMLNHVNDLTLQRRLEIAKSKMCDEHNSSVSASININNIAYSNKFNQIIPEKNIMTNFEGAYIPASEEHESEEEFSGLPNDQTFSHTYAPVKSDRSAAH